MAAVDQETFQNNVLEIDTLPQFEVVELKPLLPNYLVKQHISTSIFLMICAVLITAAYFYLPDFQMFLPYVIGLFVLLFLWNYYTNYMVYKRMGYAVRERDIIYKRGFLFEKNTVVPFNRVQHVSTNRGMLDKMLGLSTLKVFTAGGSGSDVSIPGLNPETANSLKEALSDRMAGHV